MSGNHCQRVSHAVMWRLGCRVERHGGGWLCPQRPVVAEQVARRRGFGGLLGGVGRADLAFDSAELRDDVRRGMS